MNTPQRPFRIPEDPCTAVGVGGTCTLRSGHAGRHRSASGAVWGNTPQWALRVDPALKNACLDRARSENTTLTARVIDWMVRYARGEDWK